MSQTRVERLGWYRSDKLSDYVSSDHAGDVIMRLSPSLMGNSACLSLFAMIYNKAFPRSPTNVHCKTLITNCATRGHEP
jgi:hypothetical protein